MTQTDIDVLLAGLSVALPDCDGCCEGSIRADLTPYIGQEIPRIITTESETSLNNYQLDGIGAGIILISARTPEGVITDIRAISTCHIVSYELPIV